MINYNYQCVWFECNYEFSITQSIKDNPLIECPECKNQSLQRVIHSPTVLIKNDPKTVGLLAERNTQKMGRYEREMNWGNQKQRAKAAKQRALEELQVKLPKGQGAHVETKIPDVPPVDMSLNNLSPEQKIKYIETGVKP